MPARLTLIAHAATAASREARFSDDEPLEADAAAKTVALELHPRRFRRAFTSPARAAVDTAQALRLDAVTDAALRDLDAGRWRGLALAEIARTEPQALAAWTSDPEAAPHGGETVAALLRRVGGWLELRAADAGHSVVITHAAVIRCAVLHALDAPARCFWRLDVAPLSFTTLSHAGDHWRLSSIGKEANLPAGPAGPIEA